jgi:hypothetical protein
MAGHGTVSNEAEEECVVLRGGGYQVALGCLSGLVTLAFSTAIFYDDLVSKAIGVALVVGMGTLTVRWSIAVVRVCPSGLFLRGPFLTRRLRWEEVEQAHVVPTNINGLIAVVMVETATGKSITVDGVGSRYRRDHPESTRVGHVVSLINEYARGRL